MSESKNSLSLPSIKDLIRDTQRMIDKADEGKKKIEKQKDGKVYYYFIAFFPLKY